MELASTLEAFPPNNKQLPRIEEYPTLCITIISHPKRQKGINLTLHTRKVRFRAVTWLFMSQSYHVAALGLTALAPATVSGCPSQSFQQQRHCVVGCLVPSKTCPETLGP